MARPVPCEPGVACGEHVDKGAVGHLAARLYLGSAGNILHDGAACDE